MSSRYTEPVQEVKCYLGRYMGQRYQRVLFGTGAAERGQRHGWWEAVGRTCIGGRGMAWEPTLPLPDTYLTFLEQIKSYIKKSDAMQLI